MSEDEIVALMLRLKLSSSQATLAVEKAHHIAKQCRETIFAECKMQGGSRSEIIAMSIMAANLIHEGSQGAIERMKQVGLL
jgi:hypothetical protein